MTTQKQIVHIIDDDDAVRDSLRMLLSSVNIESKSYPNAQAFLDTDIDYLSGCILLDIRMPGMSGLELQSKLNNMGCQLPVIFITGHGDIPMAVEAMKHGAAEFIQKPFREQDLLDRISNALKKNRIKAGEDMEIKAIQTRITALSPREHEVMSMVIDGKANKVIAYDLGLSQRTVEIHRANVMEKMEAKSLADLVKMVLLTAK